MATSRDIQEIIPMLSSDKAKIRDEGIRRLSSWLEGERSIGFCKLLGQNTAKINPDEIPHAETWPFLLKLLTKCITLEISMSKKRPPKLLLAKTLRTCIQSAEDPKLSGKTLFLFSVVKMLFNHLLDVIKDVPSFQSKYNSILRYLLAVKEYRYQMGKRVYCSLVILYINKVHFGVKANTQSNSKEEVFRCIMTLHVLLENPPGDFPEDIREDLIKGFSRIFLYVRDEGKISRKLMECINTFLLKDGPNLGCHAMEIHSAVKEFLFRSWLTTHDQKFKGSFILYARVQLKLNRSTKEGSSLIEQLFDIVAEELDQNTVSFSGMLRDDKVGNLGSIHQGLFELGATVFYQASYQVKRMKIKPAAARVKDGIMRGSWLCLMYGAEDPSIAGMVLDSPFSNLVELMMELVDTYKYPLPKFTVKLAIQHMRRVIRKKANFDIMELDAIQAAKCCYVPVLFGHATDDDFICPHHSDRIYDSYVGDKNIIKFDGDHNSPRPQFYFDSITIFFHNVLNPPKDGSDEQYLHPMHSFFDKDNWGTIHEVGNINQNFNEPPPELATSSTEDAITQLRSRRPMSRTDVPSDISSLEKDEDERNGSECDLGPSSSKLYNDNLSNGDLHLHSRFIPTTSDDEYVEYAFDGSSDIPCSLEDEERMLMEAIMESLKDLETKHPQEDVQPDKGTTSPEPLDGMEASKTEANRPAETSADSMATSNENKPIDEPTLDALESCTADSTSAKNSGSSKETPASGSSSVGGSISTLDADTTSGTRATLVVQKNPAGHILDGLANRWGFNFFKSGR